MQEDSFYDLVFASDPLLLRNHFAPDGELKKWLLGGNRTPVASWAPDRVHS
jgi:soluble epoxide hydrolase/lipid-phosphate phosphatase